MGGDGLIFRGLFLFFAASCLVAQPRLTLTAGPAVAGQPVTLTVSLSGSTGANLAALQFFLPAIPDLAVSPGSAAVDVGKTVTCATVGESGCIVAGGLSLLTDGPVALLTFQAPTGPLVLPLVKLLGANPAGDSPGIPITAGPVLTLAVPVPRRNSIR